MINCIGIEAISSVILNFSIAISIIIGGIWAYIKFIRRHESANIHMSFKNLAVKSIPPNNENGVIVDVLFSNKGDRDVDLLYDTAKLSLYKCNSAGDICAKVGEKLKLQTKFEMHKGRLRAGAEGSISYWIPLKDIGLYFIEFEIDINMKNYYKSNSPKEKTIVKFSNRTYYVVNEKNIVV